MSDPLSLGLGIYTAFKEVYLVAKFMHSTVLSAKNHDSERKELREDFEYELLFLQSLGRIYLAQNGIMNDPKLDQRWLKQVYIILERMRLVCGDYARIAAEDDAEYKQYSPFLNREMFNTKVIEFNIDEPLPSLPSPTFFTTRALRWFGIKTTMKVNESIESWKWALVERKKFEEVLRKFQKLNGQLKDILPLYSAAQAHSQCQNRTSTGLPDRQDENTRRLGITPHIRLRQLSLEVNADKTDFSLKGRLIEAPSDAGSLVVCKLLTSNRPSTDQKVLVEYKQYLPSISEVMPSSTDIELHRKPVHQLASLLKSAGSHDLSTLPFRGIIEQVNQHRHAFVFDFPTNIDQSTDPRSLYMLIEASNIDDRLDLFQRFQVAKQVAKSIGAFHADGWVHKSIRSESVVFFRDKSTQILLVQSPYLVNFEYSRPETAVTKYDFDNDFERNLYRHPDRQGRPKTTFSKLHDIYALGVVLLEIGLWQTAPNVFKGVKSKIPADTVISAAKIRSIFINVAKKRLAHHMGPGYLEAVLACLDGQFDDITSRADFPMMFHERVVQKLDVKSISK